MEAYVGERVIEFYQGVELICTHPRAKQPGEWHTRTADYPPEKAAYLERTPTRCREIAQRIGPATAEVVAQLLGERPLDRLRTVQAILRLEETVGARRVEAACRRALHFGDVRYRRIKDILTAALDQDPLPESGPSPTAEGGGRTYVFARSAAEFAGGAGVGR